MTERPKGFRFDFTLGLAASYLAVAVFWCLFHNAWLTILFYHGQIVWRLRGSHPKLGRPRLTLTTFLILPSALAGPVLAFLLPHVARMDLAAWLDRYHLTGSALLAMTFYFGLVHPVLEQLHWAPLRERTPHAHAAFAGYHVLVLYSLLPVPWLVACFVVLWLASWLWTRMVRAAGSYWPAITSQAIADIGIVLVAVRSQLT